MTQRVTALRPSRWVGRGRAEGAVALPSGRGLWRFGVVLAILAVFLSGEATGRVVAEALSEAYLAVTVFVAGTLILLRSLEVLFKRDIGEVLMRLRHWQVPAAALLGAFPGCGGAIVIVTQYTRGAASFGALVAALTSTMGDAMFLLLAREPSTGLLVLALGLVVGTLTGWAVDALPWRYPRAEPKRAAGAGRATATRVEGEARSPSGIGMLWLGLALPGLVLGILGAFQVETDALFGSLGRLEPTLWLGVAGALLSLLIWAVRGNPDREPTAEPACSGGAVGLDRVIVDTCFISSWVVFAFLAFELPIHFADFDPAGFFALWAPAVPLMAVLIGWLPGCGPQILVTSLYLSGALPLSAQLGNAISNDGDALFPALALAPRAALVATLVSTIPALLVGYGAYLLVA